VRLYLIRHGETEYNRKRLIQGHTKVPLNELGIEQATRLGRRMTAMPLDKIYASDLRRTEMTASILSEHTGIPVQYEPLFRERHPGTLTDGTFEDAWPFFNDLEYEPPEGESVTVFAQRVKKAFITLLTLEGQTNNNVAVVSHGMVCGAFMNVCLGASREEVLGTHWANTSLTIVDYDTDWRLVTLADASHLDELEDAAPHSPGA
jgi:broad specificity phosphatase PhoE